MRILDFSDGFESNSQPTIIGVTASSISVTPVGGITSTDVQSALAELDTKKVAKITSVDKTIPRFSGTGGDLQDSGVTVDDSNNISGVNNVTATGPSQNIGSSNTATTVNIGTGTGANVINIGGANSQINMTGTVENQNVTNMNVTDKLITVNKGGSTGSGAVAGIQVEEGGVETGSVKTSSDRNAWEFVAPNTAGITSLKPGASNDEIALLAKAQTLSNKTWGDAPTFTQVVTPTNPSSGFSKIYPKSNGKWYTLNSAGIETEVGSGSGGTKNYLAAITTSNGINPGNGDFEFGSTTGWSLGNVALTNNFPSGTPTFGSGADAGLSISAVSTGQLAGSYSLSYSSGGTTVAGNFLASDPFYIDTEDQAKPLTYEFYYKVNAGAGNGNFSGTSSNSFGIAIYDVTNSAWIMPNGVWSVNQSSGIGVATGSFQTTANSTQYRLVFFNANATNISGIQIYLDDFSVGPQTTAPIVPVVTDWSSYLPTWTADTTNPSIGNGTIQGYYRQEGDSGHFRIIVVSGTTTSYGSGNWGFSIPFSIDSSKVPANANFPLGVATATDDSSNRYEGFVSYKSGSTVYAMNAKDTGINAPYGPTSPFTASAGHANYTWCLDFVVPIAGWASNIQVANGLSPREVTFKGSVNQTINNTTPTLTLGTVLDTHGGYSSSTYKVVVPGFYKFYGFIRSGSVAWTTTNAIEIYVSVNGGANSIIGRTNPAGGGTYIAQADFADGIECNSGDTLVFKAYSDVSSSFTGDLIIEGPQGSSAVALTETVKMLYRNGTGGSVTGLTTNFTYDTKISDSHNAFNNGIYNIPSPGLYSIKMADVLTTSSISYRVYQNGSWAQTIGYQNTANKSNGGAVDLECLEGDQISIRADANATRVGSANDCFLSICKIG